MPRDPTVCTEARDLVRRRFSLRDRSAAGSSPGAARRPAGPARNHRFPRRGPVPRGAGGGYPRGRGPRAPLFVWHSDKDETELRDWLGVWKASEILAVGGAAEKCKALPDVRVRTFPDEKRTFSAALEFQARRGSVRVLVAANPADGGLSALAPWLAAQKHAALLLTDAK